MAASRFIRRRIAGALAGTTVALALAATTAFAQTASLGVPAPPFYVDAPITVQVIADGFEEEPQPEVAFDPPSEGRLTLRGVTPNVSTTMQIVNGQISTSKQVKVVFTYEFVAPEPGRYSVGPFRVSQNGVERATRSAVLDVRAIPESPDQRIVFELPDREIYVGERIAAALEWWAESDMASNLFNQRAYLPLLEATDRVRILDPPVPNAQASLVIETPSGLREFEAAVERRRHGGKTWIVRSVPLTLIALQPGTVAIEPASLVVDEAVRWRRDFFGQRTPTQTRKLRAVDEKRDLVVKPLPLAGKPDSFAGAVGSGFSIESSADRTVVATGDPITLAVTLRGDGTLESASLPPLARAGLADADFATPTTPTPGTFDGGMKRFNVQVRVRNPEVREIPPIEYAWFDPQREEYRTTASKPIALSVREAEIVGADAVVRSSDAKDAPLPAADAAGEEGAESGGGRDIIFTLTGADLAVERSLDLLDRNDRPGWGAWLLDLLLYAIGLAALAGGYAVARRREGDGGASERARELETTVRGIDDAITTARLARALRKLGSLEGGGRVAGSRRKEYDELLRALDEVAYAPGGDEAAPPKELADRAWRLAHEVAKEAGR